MDQKCLDSIVNVICESNMSDIDIRSVEIWPILCYEDENGKKSYRVYIHYSVPFFSQKSSLSEAWIAENLLLFTVFDAYLENKYNLKEGTSFKEHYNRLPQSDEIEIIQKNCYRIIKIIRNSIQHNLSSVSINSGSYNISYNHRGTNHILQINKEGISNLYTIVLNIIKGYIIGMDVPYRTNGHFIGIIRTLYSDMINGIIQISDDMGSHLISVSIGQQFRATVRYPVQYPRIIEENEFTITFDHIERNRCYDIKSDLYQQSTDYIYDDYMLPQEIGDLIIGKGNSYREIIRNTVIRFKNVT